jgi:hypothetical protein
MKKMKNCFTKLILYNFLDIEKIKVIFLSQLRKYHTNLMLCFSYSIPHAVELHKNKNIGRNINICGDISIGKTIF